MADDELVHRKIDSPWYNRAMVAIKYTGDELWARIERAVEKVKDRMRRVTQALGAAGVPYAVIGGNAVQLWVAQVDERATRNTQDVDILLRREDLTRAAEVLGKSGFTYCQVAGVDMFLDGPEGTPRDAVHVIIAGERVRPNDLAPAPDTNESVVIKDTQALSLEALIRMKLTANRDKDRVHIRDMLAVGLIDPSWLPRFPDGLRVRLQQLIDTPEG
jgi:hypothetical protein